MDLKEAMKKYVEELDPFLSMLQVKTLEAGNGYAKLYMKFRTEITRLGGIVNGGAIATLIDATGGAAVMTVNDEGKNQVTVTLNIEYIRPISKDFYAEAWVKKRGKNLTFVYIEVKDVDGNLCAAANGVWMYI
ncbi:hypothetical protein GCM10007981_17600 [Thermocladium modestius]|uniref:Thioesterase domain-containing protein n=1 Tax=Thermocladium modestius TaxID=62609 RepID=A0A830GWH9_9CREN|nr:PaaI family thioesterase [Thermocladium modestius]GGP22258.1 hypothetical protein GCM10007981_17600 [Thermocladium modestius]